MKSLFARTGLWAVGTVLVLGGAAAVAVFGFPGGDSRSTSAIAATPQAIPASVAVVEKRAVALWDEFSGRLEAIERVNIRPRVAGAVQAVHFREGARVAKDDLLITIDPDPYAAEVQRAEAQVAAAQARVSLTQNELDRGRQLWDSRAISQRDLDQRVNAHREAEANLRSAEAVLQTANLNLGYTEVRAPVAGRVGRLEITVGNLVGAGPEAPVLTTLVSIDPIYASFNVNEEVVARALQSLGSNAHTELDRIPVQMVTGTDNGTWREGHLQLIDNRVDAASGTVRVRAVFPNPGGDLMPGQFARLRMGRAETEPAVTVSERAIGTDQNKKFVTVVDAENKAAYREVTLGPAADGLRVITRGLSAGERVVVNGLQRVRPGALVEPRLVPMLAEAR